MMGRPQGIGGGGQEPYHVSDEDMNRYLANKHRNCVNQYADAEPDEH